MPPVDQALVGGVQCQAEGGPLLLADGLVSQHQGPQAWTQDTVTGEHDETPPVPRLARLVMCCSVEARSPDTQAASIVLSAPLLSTWIFSSRS